MKELINCTILGSFRFKEIIDATRIELEQLGVRVLAPEIGMVFTPPIRRHIRFPATFNPLNGERGMPIKTVEDQFLGYIARSDFVYLVNFGGYVGDVVSLETGFAIASNVPIYSREKVDLGLDMDPAWQNLMKGIVVMSVSDAINDFKARNIYEC